MSVIWGVFTDKYGTLVFIRNLLHGCMSLISLIIEKS